MLNGVAPILIFTFPPNIPALNPLFNALSGIPLIGDVVAQAGIPIPLYLDERITGLYVESEAKNLDIETTVEPRYDDKKPFIYQKALNSSVTINMIASRSSLLLPALLALTDLIVPKLVSQKYSVTYLNGSTLIFGGLLQGLNTSQGADDDLIRITMQIQKTDQRPAPGVPPVLNAVTGSVPGLAG